MPSTLLPVAPPPELSALRAWRPAQWGLAAVVTVIAALLIGVPTGVVPSNLYTRMTPVRWWDYPVWATSAVLVGLTAATYLRASSAAAPPVAGRSGRTMLSTLMAAFAVGCPICNKLVVGLIGVSGALSYWAPLQPILGALSVGLLLVGLIVRLRGQLSCPVPASA